MRYNRFPIIRPEIGKIIYVIGNTGQEQLAVYLGGTRFDFYGTDRKGYYARLWRELDEVERKSFDDSQSRPVIKRKYTRRLESGKARKVNKKKV